MSAIGRAYALAAGIHKDQVDKAGVPYFEHVHEVARRTRKSFDRMYPEQDETTLKFREDAIVTAILHDVIEDSPSVSRGRLRDIIYEEFGDRVHQALDCMTKYPGEEYDRYIERVSTDWIARIVKLADLSHNLEAWRLPPGISLEHHLASREKYNRAFVRLMREDSTLAVGEG